MADIVGKRLESYSLAYFFLRDQHAKDPHRVFSIKSRIGWDEYGIEFAG
jgi:hypothetical protein